MLSVMDQRFSMHVSKSTCLGLTCLIVFAEYLFPAANLTAKQKEDPNFSLTTVAHTELYFALNSRCSTKASRQVSRQDPEAPLMPQFRR